jgi:hypothetical protein
VYQLSGNPVEWAASITRWGYHPGGSPWLAPVQVAHRLVTHPYRYLTTDRMALYDTLYGVTGMLFVLAIPFVWRRFGAGYGLFMAANLWLPLSSGVFEGVGRYCSVLFPFFIWLADGKSRFGVDGDGRRLRDVLPWASRFLSPSIVVLRLGVRKSASTCRVADAAVWGLIRQCAASSAC